MLFEYCHASLILGNVDVSYLEDGNVYSVLKNKTAIMFFFSQKKLLVLVCVTQIQRSPLYISRHGV